MRFCAWGISFVKKYWRLDASILWTKVMDDKKRSAILKEAIEDVCIKFPETRDCIEKKLREICSRENLPYHQVIYFWFYHKCYFCFCIRRECPFYAFPLTQFCRGTYFLIFELIFYRIYLFIINLKVITSSYSFTSKPLSWIQCMLNLTVPHQEAAVRRFSSKKVHLKISQT